VHARDDGPAVHLFATAFQLQRGAAQPRPAARALRAARGVRRARRPMQQRRGLALRFGCCLAAQRAGAFERRMRCASRRGLTARALRAARGAPQQLRAVASRLLAAGRDVGGPDGERAASHRSPARITSLVQGARPRPRCHGLERCDNEPAAEPVQLMTRKLPARQRSRELSVKLPCCAGVLESLIQLEGASLLESADTLCVEELTMIILGD